MADTNQNTTGMNDANPGGVGRGQAGTGSDAGRGSGGDAGTMGEKGGQARWDSDTPTGNRDSDADMDTDMGSDM